MIQILLSFLLSQSVFGGCLIDHLKEGIQVNLDRQKIYSAMSLGATENVSQMLLSYEYNLIYLVRLTGFEKRFSPPFLCDEFKSTPNPLPAVYQSSKPELKHFKPILFLGLKRKYQKLIKDRDLLTLHASLVQEIDDLQKEPRFNCMTRHLLESMARVSWLALNDDQKTESAFKLLKYMPIALFGTKQLDVMASAHQAKGLPILCHDLPLIDYK